MMVADTMGNIGGRQKKHVENRTTLAMFRRSGCTAMFVNGWSFTWCVGDARLDFRGAHIGHNGMVSLRIFNGVIDVMRDVLYGRCMCNDTCSMGIFDMMIAGVEANNQQSPYQQHQQHQPSSISSFHKCQVTVHRSHGACAWRRAVCAWPIADVPQRRLT